MLRFLPFFRCLFCALSALAVLGAPAGAVRQDQNAITPLAPGWIFAASGPGVPVGQSAQDFLVGKDTTITHAGKASATLKATSDTPSLFRAITQGIRTDAYRGKRLRLFGYVKTNGVTTWAALWMRVDGEQGSLAFDNMETRPIKGTTDWQLYSVVLDVPKEAEAIYFGAGLAGPEQVWVDDLSLEVVDPKKVASTDAARFPVKPVNLDFETLPTASDPLPGYKTSDGSVPATLDTSVAHEGKTSVTLNGPTDSQIEQVIAADAYRDKRVRLSGYLKTRGVTGWTGLWMRVDGPTGKELSFDNMHEGKQDRSVKGTTDWQAYSVVLDVPPKARAIYFGALLYGPGQAWVDDLSLEVVDPQQVASTDLGNSIPATYVARYKKVIAERKIKLPLQPVNLDFEQ